MATNKKGPSISYTTLFMVLLPIVFGIAARYWLFTGVDTPPSDFGSGHMFDVIAKRYDMVNRVLALRMDVGWRQRMVQIVKERVEGIQQAKLLDVATGTADVALMLATEIPESSVLGLDPSENMLNVGRIKIHQHELQDRIDLQWGDARDLMTIEEMTFDGSTMAFGIRNVPERKEALCQIHRLLKPGSVFCVLEFSEPPENSGFLPFLARIFIRHVVPVVGGILSGAPREYLHLQNSIKDFPTPQEFGELLGKLECGPDGRGSFRLDELIQMNFDSVQLYVATSVIKTE